MCRRPCHLQHRIFHNHRLTGHPGTTVSWVARLLGLSTPLEKTGNDFGVELPEEIDSNLHDMTITQEMLEQADTLKDMNLPKGTLVMIVKRGDEYSFRTEH